MIFALDRGYLPRSRDENFQGRQAVCRSHDRFERGGELAFANLVVFSELGQGSNSRARGRRRAKRARQSDDRGLRKERRASPKSLSLVAGHVLALRQPPASRSAMERKPKTLRDGAHRGGAAAFDDLFLWCAVIPAAQIELAKSIRLEDELARRGVKLRGGVDRCGPCPRCGGDDRFSINRKKQVFRCRQCGAKGGGSIDLVMFLDGSDFKEAVATLTVEPRLGPAPAACKPLRHGTQAQDVARRGPPWRRCPRRA